MVRIQRPTEVQAKSALSALTDAKVRIINPSQLNQYIASSTITITTLDLEEGISESVAQSFGTSKR